MFLAMNKEVNIRQWEHQDVKDRRRVLRSDQRAEAVLCVEGVYQQDIHVLHDGDEDTEVVYRLISLQIIRTVSVLALKRMFSCLLSV